MNKYLIPLLLLFSMQVAQSQPIELSSPLKFISYAGSFEHDSVRIYLTLGEPFVGTYSNDSISVRLGLSRGSLEVSTEQESLIESVDIQVFPNPVTSRVALHLNALERGMVVEVSLIGLEGKVLKTIEHLSLVQVQTLSLDMGSYPTGTYLLQIRDKNSSRIASYKLVKY